MTTPKGALQPLHCPCCNKTTLHDVYEQKIAYKSMNRVLTMADCLSCKNTRTIAKVVNDVKAVS